MNKPPKDGTEIIVPITCRVRVYWDPDLKRWILSRPLHRESIPDDDVKGWEPIK